MCILKSRTGQLISKTVNRDVLNTNPAEGATLRGLSLQMQNVSVGEKRNILLNAADAYGYYDPQKVILFPKSKLPKGLKVGETLHIAGKSGTVRNYKILELHGSFASLDGNHPLAGQDLIFEIEVLSARNASEDEILEASLDQKRQLLN